jgi:hypothetical protein
MSMCDCETLADVAAFFDSFSEDPVKNTSNGFAFT